MALLERAEEEMHPRFVPTQILGKFHERLAMSLSPLIFVLIAGPLSMVFRTGDRMVSFLLSFVIGLFVYFPSFALAGQLIKMDKVHPILAAWGGNVFLALLGIGLMVFVVRR
jgi:lipopolysaccharide export LptBFGC system permease protein LptF